MDAAMYRSPSRNGCDWEKREGGKRSLRSEHLGPEK